MGSRMRLIPRLGISIIGTRKGLYLGNARRLVSRVFDIHLEGAKVVQV
jgi:hypothetical protein